MVDIPGSSSTTTNVSVGSTVDSDLEFVGDHDWFRIALTAGQKITIAVNLLTLEDSYVYIRNASGTILGENDDGGGGRGSRLVFTAPTSGNYYIDAAAWVPDEPVPGYTGTGTYRLSVSNYVAPPVGTLDDIAYQMTHGFFQGASHHFNVTQGGAITVDFSGVTAAGRTIAVQALQQWTDIIGVNFVEQSGNAQITFDDLQQGTGAFANATHADGITTSAIVNVSLQRLNLHTYMHEIGHALGLGHTSNSNAGTAASVYPDDALWSNDGAAVSIMSYFDNAENAYYSSRGFSHVPIRTPQVADILAMGNLYGLSTTTRTGDTTYGFNNSSGREAFDAALFPNVAYTIFDSAGTDTLDYSGFSNNQLIDLNAEAFSNVGALVGNVVIARGVVIENAIGGGGWDVINGNAAGNIISGNGGGDTISGYGGDDLIDGGAGADSLDGGAGNDRIIYDPTDSRLSVFGGSDFDVLLVSNMAVPTEFNLNGQGFEQAERTLFDSGGNAWSSVSETYVGNWQITQQVTVADDLSRVVTEFDWSNSTSTSQVWSSFDPAGHLSSRDELFDNGSRTFINVDQEGSQIWSADWFTFDTLGRLDSEDIVYDSGAHTYINLDQAGVHEWAQDWFVFDAQGRLDSQDVIYDAGSRTFINLDQAGSFAWSQNWFNFDALGRLDSEDVVGDDGSHTFINLDQGGESSWSSAWFTYDTLGRLDTQDVNNDDSTRTFTNYDQAGIESFELTALLYDANGTAYQQIIKWDDGTTSYVTL